MGLAVRAFVAPGDAALATRGTYPDLRVSRRRLWGPPAYARIPRRRHARLRGVAGRSTERSAADRLSRQSRTTRAAVSSHATRSRVSTKRLPHDSCLLLDEAYADFVDEGELLPPAFEDRLIRLRTFSKAYGMAGARIGYALTHGAQRRRRFRRSVLHYGINRNAQVGALASLERRRVSQLRRARDRPRARGLLRAWRASSAAATSNRGRTSSASKWTRAQRATRVMDELLARGVWIRKPGAPPLDSYIRVSAGHRTDAPRLWRRAARRCSPKSWSER